MSDIEQADLVAFFQNHLSADAVANFGQTFQNPAAFQQNFDQAEIYDYAEEDDLGYYDDGVKRTLTDEQIEMFRLAELREARRKQERAQSRNPRSTKAQDESNDEANNSQPCRQGSGLPRSARVSKNKKRGGLKPRHEPKPDLRKRTWDVVEPGLDTLEYD
ncbi:hypothetical protein OCS_05793 [Ophiocordyceps sinensis CO18]|uniref:Uncharacterized protein n=1 Tax=Ophiocordyceps sinensis (strain Co18 / CGMCC 3.14243) TaxID=911162 RepID=T5A7U5_OPHSC|nr:hypothetical protein OCS_05793 [Ophiocordyceps sinensis CO18]